MRANAGRWLCHALALFETARALQSGGPGAVAGFAPQHQQYNAYGIGAQQQQQPHYQQVCANGEHKIHVGKARRPNAMANIMISSFLECTLRPSLCLAQPKLD